MKNKLQRGIMLLCAMVSVPFAQAGARLYATNEGSAVKLQWHPTTWSADEVGFVLKRRPVKPDASAPWTALHAGVLRPSINYARDWTLLGFNKKQITATNERIKLQDYSGRRTLTEAEMLAILRKKNEFDQRVCIEMIRDATNAFAYGLGYIDNTAKSGIVYEYGLFEASEGGVESPQPVAVRRPFNSVQRKDWAQVTGLEISPRLQPESLIMRWRMQVPQAEAMAVAYFIVERRGEADTEWNAVSQETPYRLNTAKTEARWIINEKVTPTLPKPPLHYRLTPVDMFQSKLPAVEYTVDSLEPDPIDSKLFGPSQLTGKVENGKLHIEWTQQATKWRGNPLQGFRLRSRWGGGEKFPLWLNPVRQADIDVSELGSAKEFNLETVYLDWDDREERVESSEVLNLDSLK